jgi:hypothetical protein
VILSKALLAVCSVLAEPADSGEGSIGGVVVNGSDGNTPAERAEVVLRVKVDDQFVIAAETLADARGAFSFEPLPVDQGFLYLPGANRDDVHYPGARVRLAPQRPHARVELVVYDAVPEPSPLIARRHDILIRCERGVLRVTETILVDNPSARTYVGNAVRDDAQPVTLALAIPSDFERTTFEKEFFGRRFSLTGGRLVTGVPWPPGESELKLTYLLRNEDTSRVWRRPLDLPCSEVRLRVVGDKPEEISCNLGPRESEQWGERVFESSGQSLPAGHVVRVELGHLPVPWITYGRWLALVGLVGLIAVAGVVTIRRKGTRARDRQDRSPTPPSGHSRRMSSGAHTSLRGRRRRASRRHR